MSNKLLSETPKLTQGDRKKVLLKTCIAIAINSLIIPSAGAANLTVNTTQDANQSNNNCSLREAILSINAGAPVDGCAGTNFGTDDQINFDSSLIDSTITLNGNLPVITSSVTINGLGQDDLTINGAGAYRMFDMTASNPSNDLRFGLNNIKLSYAQVLDAGGAAVRVQSWNEVTIDRCIFDSNSSNAAGAMSWSGGVTGTITNSSFTNNSATSSAAGAIDIRSGSEVTISDTVISNNTAANGGGGLVISNTNATILDSEISDNNTRGFGGGIRITGSRPTSGSSVTISNTAITDNMALGGGGIFLQGTQPGATSVSVIDSQLVGNVSETRGVVFSLEMANLTVQRSTVSGNNGITFSEAGAISARFSSNVMISDSVLSNNTSQRAGAIFMLDSQLSIINSTISGNVGESRMNLTRRPSYGAGFFSNSSVTLTNTTVVGNRAEGDTPYTGGFKAEANSSITFNNSLIAGNRGPITNEISVENSTLTMLGRNLFGDAQSTNDIAFSGFDINPDNVITATSDGVQPTSLNQIIAPLADNGGTTLTHALVANSPAINRASQTQCQLQGVVNDQRGVSRAETQCDIGAFESSFTGSSPMPESFFVVPTKNGNTVIFSL